MTGTDNDLQYEIDHLYRSESGKMVSVLTRIFGSHHLSLAEDVVQDSFHSAWENWSQKGRPDNPPAWLMLTAKRKAINILRRDRYALNFSQDIDVLLKSEWSLATTVEKVFMDDEIQDSQLRMIFTCCHPSMKPETQIALTLKTLCGFSTIEIARALLTEDDTIQKRIYRAKQKIKAENIVFHVPSGHHLDRRLHEVLLAIYLLFNEGYNSSTSSTVIRKDLCYEAMRLVGILAHDFPYGQGQSFALLSLLCFHVARFDGRIDDQGCIIILQDQDRTKWNQELIEAGIDFLHRSAKSPALSTYHLEASIAAMHCTTPSFEETNWKQIYQWYNELEKIKPSPIIQLNKAIISGKIHGPQHAIRILQKLEEDSRLKKYYLLSASLGQFYLELQRPHDAIISFHAARKLTNSPAEKLLLDRRIREIEQYL